MISSGAIAPLGDKSGNLAGFGEGTFVEHCGDGLKGNSTLSCLQLYAFLRDFHHLSASLSHGKFGNESKRRGHFFFVRHTFTFSFTLIFKWYGAARKW